MMWISGRQEKGMFGASRTFLGASTLSPSINRSGPWEEYYADVHIYTERTITYKNKTDLVIISTLSEIHR